MSGVVLTINAGSSSIKFSVFEATDHPQCRLIGQIEGLGASVHCKAVDGARSPLIDRVWPAGEGPDSHASALAEIIGWLEEELPGVRVEGVGHRIVHGGRDHTRPVLIDDDLVAELARLTPLAPLHQPHNLAGVVAARAHFPDAPQVACFDTAFHRTQAFVAESYALPRSFYEEGVRRYGFHGLSYEYVGRRLSEIAPLEAAGRVIIAHLGNGCSLAAVKGGRSVATTLGFSSLDGVPMGTRCGQIDPGVLFYLIDQKGMSTKEVADLLFRNSGLKGMSGLSHDLRVLEASDDPQAKDAIEHFVYRVRRETGSLAAALGGVDALVFTAGIGENAARVRARILDGLQWLGVTLDPAANDRSQTVISSADSKVKVFVIPTDEEAMIARHTIHLLGLGVPGRLIA
ncbi:MAG: acetate/propionate family kinase [Methylacidiphilales bacterium]|nr:acetate/propionate family kinase [Candidatus Methylacidiphilales bacterium]